MSNRRVVVTGIGLVSSLGIGTDANWNNLLAGKSGVSRITKFDVTGYAAQIAAEVQGFDPLNWVEKKEVKKMDLFIQFAIAASQFAMDDAKLQITDENAEEVGAFIGSGIGGFSTIEREHIALLEGGPRKVSPFFIPSSLFSRLIVGGATWWNTERAVMPASSPPAPPSRCPVIDLVDDTASFWAWSPKQRLMASVSSLSLNGVDVPCALM